MMSFGRIRSQVLSFLVCLVAVSSLKTINQDKKSYSRFAGLFIVPHFHLLRTGSEQPSTIAKKKAKSTQNKLKDDSKKKKSRGNVCSH